MVLAQVATLLMLTAVAPSSVAEEAPPPGCYTKLEQRALLSRREIVPLAEAIRAARPQQIGDVLRAQLCQGPKGAPAYVLTLLPRNGKVTRVIIDAASGTVISGG
jgi:uncharacterized membrane protein YkoI